MQNGKGFVIWLYGLPSAGKTTLANALLERLPALGIQNSLRLDGDVLRKGLCSDLGFSDEDRTENIRRAAHVASLASKAGVAVVASLITPLKELRQLVQSIVGDETLQIAFVQCSVDECVKRDVKGLYAKALSGKIKGMTGIDSLFEPGEEDEFSVASAESSIDDCVDSLCAQLASRGFVK